MSEIIPKIEQEELSKLQSLNSRVLAMKDEIAEASIRHFTLCSLVGRVENELVNHQNELAQKYGKINIDMSTGAYTVRDENEN